MTTQIEEMICQSTSTPIVKSNVTTQEPTLYTTASEMDYSEYNPENIAVVNPMQQYREHEDSFPSETSSSVTSEIRSEEEEMDNQNQEINLSLANLSMRDQPIDAQVIVQRPALEQIAEEDENIDYQVVEKQGLYGIRAVDRSGFGETQMSIDAANSTEPVIEDLGDVIMSTDGEVIIQEQMLIPENDIIMEEIDVQTGEPAQEPTEDLAEEAVKDTAPATDSESAPAQTTDPETTPAAKPDPATTPGAEKVEVQTVEVKTQDKKKKRRPRKNELQRLLE